MNKYLECETLEDVIKLLKGVIKANVKENWVYDHCVPDEAKNKHTEAEYIRNENVIEFCNWLLNDKIKG